MSHYHSSALGEGFYFLKEVYEKHTKKTRGSITGGRPACRGADSLLAIDGEYNTSLHINIDTNINIDANIGVNANADADTDADILHHHRLFWKNRNDK